MATVLRIGLIGAGGNMRLRHIPGFRAIDGVECTGVVNRSRESSERAAAEFGIERVFDSPEHLCADPDIDAVCIGTWPYMHRDYTVMALEAGKHVLCEARMANNLAEAEDMLAASQRHPALVAQLVPAPFDFRLGPTITRLLGEGALGEVLEVTVTVMNGSGLDPSTPIHWRQRGDYSGKNVMTFGIFVEVIQRWLGDHARVVADGAVVIPERTDPEAGELRKVDVPDTWGVLGRLSNGARISYLFSSVAAGCPSNGIVIYGSEATLRWNQGDPRRLADQATLARHGKDFEPVEPDPGTDRGWLVEEDFVSSIRDGAPVRLTSFEDGVRYMRVIDAAHHSWAEGRAVDIAS